MIPAFRLEEHHEAFLVWYYAVRRGMLAPVANTLLHVDEHSDWSTPRLTRPLESLGDDLNDAADFTYNELDVGNFIWPAVYLGMFAEVFWVRRNHTLDTNRRRMFIRPANAQRTEFVTGIDTGIDTRVVAHLALSPDMRFEPGGEVVLGIDLDYFLSNRYPDYSGKRLEVTRAAYDEFLEDRYHFLRLAPGSRITAREESSHYYFYFGRTPAGGRAAASECAHDELLRRMDAFVGFLERSAVTPRLILSARSVHSGYTPREQYRMIEEVLWQRLGQLYELVFCDLGEIAAGYAQRSCSRR